MVLVSAASAQRPDDPLVVDSGLVVRAWVGSVAARGRLLMPMHVATDSVAYCRFPGPPCVAPVQPHQVGWFHPREFDHLDVQVGTKARHGAWVGAVSGGLVIGGLAAAFSGFCEYRCPSDTEVLFKGLVGGGLVGGLVGALIGSGFPRFERRF
ncbi:MAG: hypothetical protein KC544_14175 [Gemmatimonadetes bacterium]|nr:hypothetical protein [Gemmatimonadota bacterium]